MAHEYAFKIAASDKIALKDYDPSYTADLSKTNGNKLFEEVDSELAELQEIMYAAQQNSVLIVLQGMDTSGKDGTIGHVMGNVNPQGCRVNSFKVPTAEEAAHDFLWRIHGQTPGKGMMEIFNRSHYEDVLVTRVHNLVPEATWKKRYKQINQFEELLTDNGTIILKFFLYIDKDTQLERLEAREANKDKRWKLSPSDFAERRYWDDYIAAYEAALSNCSTKIAPWYIVPANHKWFRDLAVAKVLVNALQPYKQRWSDALQERGAKVYAELEKLHPDQKKLSHA